MASRSPHNDRKRRHSSLDPDSDPDSSSEWEYEYHPTEKETFYITLDLSAAPSIHKRPAFYAASAGKGEGDSASAAAEGKAGPSVTEADRTHSEQPDTRNAGPSTSSGADNTDKGDGVSGNKLQVLDLASNEPLVLYEGSVFRCEWRETLGSDLVFAAPKDVPEGVEPLATDSKGQWVLLAKSETTLLGVPVEARRRQGKAAAGAHGDGGEDVQGEVDGEDEDKVRDGSRAEPFTILMESSVSGARVEQASFLEQLMAIKQARGEKDVVYIGKGRSYMDEHGNVKPGPLLPREPTHGVRWEDEVGANQDENGDRHVNEEEDDEAPEDEEDAVQEPAAYDPALLDLNSNPSLVKARQGEASSDLQTRSISAARPSIPPASPTQTPNVSPARAIRSQADPLRESVVISPSPQPQKFPVQRVRKSGRKAYQRTIRGGGLFRDYNVGKGIDSLAEASRVGEGEAIAMEHESQSRELTLGDNEAIADDIPRKSMEAQRAVNDLEEMGDDLEGG